ncbi:MAG TPA: 30S ribosomal protein S3ae [Ferroplasma sp.]|jgi:small subunit ribosomal protein S3Ae|nr:30S ribosomal protein S3ae [Ferroplasma sp.]
MADRRRSTTKDKWKEKSWYTIVAPSYFGEKEIGLSPSADPKYMINRTIAVPVSTFTGNFKKASSMVLFQVDNCEGKRCTTKFIGHEVSDDTIRRMVRRRRERMDIVTDVKTSDLYNIAVKLVLVADQKLTGTKRSEVRATVVDYIVKKAKEMDLGAFANYIIGDDVYGDLVNSIKDVYPIRKIEVRKTEIGKRDEMPTNMEQEPVEALPN